MLENINIQAVLQWILKLIPQGNGILNSVLQMAQMGNTPDAIMTHLEGMHPEVKDQEIWKSLKGKSSQDIEKYAGNIIKSLGIVK